MSSGTAGAEQTVRVNGVRLWTLRHGSGRPLVLLHGGAGLYDTFDELAAMIDDVAELHRYDQRGCGRSERTPPYDVSTFIADLDALREHWGHDRWIVAGHSFGAGLALAYAVAHPERVEALIQIAGTGVIDDWSEEYHAEADARRTPADRTRLQELRVAVKGSSEAPSPALNREYCILTWLADFADRANARSLAASLVRPYGPSYDVSAAVGKDWKRMVADGSFAEQVRAIAAPVLVLHGAEDPRPVRLAERLAASLPNATLEVIDSAGHVPWLERPEPVRQALRTFLARVGQETVAEAAPR